MNLIKKYPLSSFFLIAYVIMYGAVSVGVFGLLDVPFVALAIVGSFVPLIAAVTVLGVTEGKPGIKKMSSKFLVWKVGYKWYLAAVLVTILSAAVSVSYLIYNNLPIPELPILELLLVLIFGLSLGPLSEEGGWSGYALPRLQSRYSALTSSLILGAIWAVWHLPLWFIPDMAWSTMNFGLFFVALVAVRLVMGWAYNNTKGSLLIAVSFHAFFNFGNEVGVEFLGVPMNAFLYLGGVGLVAYAIWVTIAAGPANLSRKHEKIVC
jgi:membrane protease YdiL (CAAX protease family)